MLKQKFKLTFPALIYWTQVDMVVWNEENKKVWAQHNSNVKTDIDETYVPILCGCMMTLRAHAA